MLFKIISNGLNLVEDFLSLFVGFGVCEML